MSLRRFVGLAGLGVLLLLVVTVWLYPSAAHFQPRNPFWNGLRRLALEFDTIPINTFRDLPTSPQATTLVIIPYVPLTRGDLAATEGYLFQGGTLVLMDDYGYGNQLLEYLGLEAHFSGKPLMDPLSNYKNQWFPRVTDISPSIITEGVAGFTLNHASSLEGMAEFVVAARSSAFSYLDLNGDLEWQAVEPTGPFPVAAYTRVGQGLLVLVSDPSLLINSMMDLDDNLAFIRNAIQVQGPVKQVFVDEGHLPKQTREEVRAVLEWGHIILATPWGLGGVVLAILLFSLRPWPRKEHKLD